MRKFLIFTIAALALAGCGSASEEKPEGVTRYYGDGERPAAEAGSHEDVESEYFQPPQPARAGVGETITLTGTNIGVRQKVTVTGVEKRGSYLAVDLELENTGITNYEGPLRHATVRFGDGDPTPVAEGAKASCSHGFEREIVYIPVGEKASGCLLFPAGEAPARELQLALEIVPTNAGGVWELG
jgi:hypothetical protein